GTAGQTWVFFYRSSLFPKPLNCLPVSIRKKPCKQVACPNCASTVLGFARERTFSTNAKSKNQSSNLTKMLIRSTSPALLQNRCYRLALCVFVYSFSKISFATILLFLIVTSFVMSTKPSLHFLPKL